MNNSVTLILQLVPIIMDLIKKDEDENVVVTKLVRFAERAVEGSGRGKERFELVTGILQQVRPAMLAGAEVAERTSRKITVVVALLKDIDANDTGLDDLLARKLSVVNGWVDGLASWVRRAAGKVPEVISSTDPEGMSPFAAPSIPTKTTVKLNSGSGQVIPTYD